MALLKSKLRIEKLHPNEFNKLALWIAVRRRERRAKERDISKVMDKVFAHHAPLLQKLAR